MSFSDERLTNPAKRFLKIKSGAVSYYDKENQKNVEITTPFSFVVLDQVASVGGWSDADESGYWSNEVRAVGKDTLTVRTSKGIKESGIWRDIKGSSSLAGAKYNSVLYIAHQSTNGMDIAKLSLSGASLNAWIEFTRSNRVQNSKVVLEGWEDAKKGAVKYKVPVFKSESIDNDTKAAAVKLDKELQLYFADYFSSNNSYQEAVDNSAPIEDFEEPIDLSNIPF